MSDVFESYERQYCEISAALSRKLTSAAHLDGERKKQQVADIKAAVDDAEGLIRKMDLEARSLQPAVKAALLTKLREYKSDLNGLKSQVKRVEAGSSAQATREELMESGMADTLAVSADQRGRLLMSTERLNHSSERIKESRRTLLETEDLGVSILQDLHQQRQSLLHANNTIWSYEYITVLQPLLLPQEAYVAEWPVLRRWAQGNKRDSRVGTGGSAPIELARQQLDLRTTTSVNMRPWLHSLIWSRQIQYADVWSKKRFPLYCPSAHTWYLGGRLTLHTQGTYAIPFDPPEIPFPPRTLFTREA